MASKSNNNPTAAILIIGAEVLSGKVEDQNGPFLIRALKQRGIDLKEIRIIDDDIDTIAAAVRSLSSRVTFLFTTGGIGPTHDDVTHAGVAQAFGQTVIRDQQLIAHLQEHYGSELNEARLKLAEVPNNAQLLFGEDTFWPIIQVENVTIFPGVPAFMRMCFASIAKRLPQAPMATGALWVGISETEIAEHLQAVQKRMPTVSIGSYPHFELRDGKRIVRVKVTVDGRNADQVKRALQELRAGIRDDSILREEPTTHVNGSDSSTPTG